MAKRRKTGWWKSFLSDTKSIREFIGKLLMFPIQVLFWPLKLIGLFHAPELKVSEKHFRPPLKVRVWNWVTRAVQTPFAGLAGFAKGLWRMIRKMGWKDWLFTSPVFLMAIFLFFVFGTNWFRTEAIENKYHVQARQAFDRGDYPLARSYYERLQQDNQLTPAQEFFWSQILSLTGEKKKAREVIDRLAPTNEAGFGRAHLIRALNIADRLKVQGRAVLRDEPEILKHLRWHLQNCKNESPKALEAWALMHSMVGEIDEAVACLKKSAKKDPTHYLLLANLCHREKRVEDRNEALVACESVFSERVKKDATDVPSRLFLAQSLILQNKFSAADQVFQAGMDLTPQPNLKDAYASFLLLQFDLLNSKETGAVEDKMALLSRALRLQVNKENAIIRRMMSLYRNAKKESPEAAAQLQKNLQNMVVSDKAAGLAHVALSEIYSGEGNTKQAIFHLESALRINPNMPQTANNLAWQLAHQSPPELERAQKLARSAVRMVPGNAQMRDTLGSILMKQGLFEDAVSEFQVALQGMPNNIQLHEKLADVLDRLKMNDLAETHRQRAAQLGSKKSNQ